MLGWLCYGLYCRVRFDVISTVATVVIEDLYLIWELNGFGLVLRGDGDVVVISANDVSRAVWLAKLKFLVMELW